MSRTAVCDAWPSLALLKYWGKHDPIRNITATPSVAVSLAGLRTTTKVRILEPGEGRDRVTVNGLAQPVGRFQQFFEAVRHALDPELHFEAESTNDFPSSAGLASSSSGFAALAIACAKVAGSPLSDPEISALARVGSASAARAVFGGFTLLEAGAHVARRLYDETYWPDLHIIVCVVKEGPKGIASRGAMEASRLTSPYYASWLQEAERALPGVLHALEERNLEELGTAMRLSYMRMFATIISADPPIQYWRPASVAVIQECEEMRRSGIGVWETMDAGPQVKLLCLAGDVAAVTKRIAGLGIGVRTIDCRVAGAPVCSVEGA